MSDHFCMGKLEVLIADESSMRCTVCGWSGWPRQIVDSTTGRILRRWAHQCACGKGAAWKARATQWSYTMDEER